MSSRSFGFHDPSRQASGGRRTRSLRVITVEQPDWLTELASVCEHMDATYRLLAFPFIGETCEAVISLLAQISIMTSGQERLRTFAEQAVATMKATTKDINQLQLDTNTCRYLQQECHQFIGLTEDITSRLEKHDSTPQPLRGISWNRFKVKLKSIEGQLDEIEQRIRRIAGLLEHISQSVCGIC